MGPLGTSRDLEKAEEQIWENQIELESTGYCEGLFRVT